MIKILKQLLLIQEPPYDDNPSNLLYHCGSQNTYRSKTRSMVR